jgi:hypothetical protein
MQTQRSMLAVNIPATLPRHLAGRLLLLSIVSGVVADALLRVTPWGINVAILVLLLTLGCATVLGESAGVVFEGEGRWLMLPAIFFAACIAWRDSPTLNVGNWIACATALGLACLTTRAGQVRRAGASQYALGLLYVVVNAFAGSAPLVRREVGWRRYRWWSAPLIAVGRGVALALPPLVIFGGLFAAADADFEALVHSTFDWDLEDATLHILLAAVYAWLLGGSLREMLIAPMQPSAHQAGRGLRLTLGFVEISVVLGLVDLLFLVFVILQLPYLFGGVVQVAQIGYSEYARRGFFELVWVAGLTLPLLLVTHWLLRSAPPGAQRVHRALAATLVALLFVIIASAVQRMQLYVTGFGLTELRLQASAFMGWIAVVLIWFLATVLRNRRQYFAFGGLVSAFAFIAALDVLNPDDLIVRTNAHFQHLATTGPFDARPFASFSADATPAIVNSLSSLDVETRRRVVQELTIRATHQSDWRTFNLSRAWASGSLQRLPREPQLRASVAPATLADGSDRRLQVIGTHHPTAWLTSMAHSPLIVVRR